MKEEILKKHDLEARLLLFSKRVILLCRSLTITVYNRRIIPQIIASSGSVGANYNEATISGSKKDFIYKLRLACKEAKESNHWLQLLEATDGPRDSFKPLIQESTEICRILHKSIITATKNPE